VHEAPFYTSSGLIVDNLKLHSIEVRYDICLQESAERQERKQDGTIQQAQEGQK
jgi:hypothetical protein